MGYYLKKRHCNIGYCKRGEENVYFMRDKPEHPQK